jgi:hypothetical protein
MKLDPAVLFRQFRHWSLHCCLNALPSFIIAVVHLKLWQHRTAIVAMLAAIATFIVLYTVLTSLPGPLSREDHLLARSLQLGTRIRAIVTAVSLPLLAIKGGMVFTPDFWCGVAAIFGINSIAHLFGHRTDPIDLQIGDGSFLPVFAVTLLEGFILSFLLLMISFFALVFLQVRERRKALNAPA